MERSYFLLIFSFVILATIADVGNVDGAPIANSTQNDDASIQFESAFTQFGKIVNEIVE